jgi:hypothetical protein
MRDRRPACRRAGTYPISTALWKGAPVFPFSRLVLFNDTRAWVGDLKHIFAKRGGSLRQPLRFQGIEVSLYRLGRVFQACSMVVSRFDHKTRRKVEERINSSGCCASISNGLSASWGKSAKLDVTIKLAPQRIAAAKTWRSSLSGRSSPAVRPLLRAYESSSLFP